MDGSGQRRDARRFEPPPWERDRFDELARKREAEAARLAEAERERAAQEPAAARKHEPSPVPTSETLEGLSIVREDAGEEGPVLDDAGVSTMLMQLQHEDPLDTKDWWVLGVYAGSAIGVLGAALVVWGSITSVRARAAGMPAVFGAVTVLILGFAFLALAAWMIVRSLRRRGDL